MSYKVQVCAKFLALARDNRTLAEDVLRQYGVEVFNSVPGHRLKAFAATVRAVHVRYLLNRLEEVMI